MARVLDVEEPWIGPGYSTYTLDGCAATWIRDFKQSLVERGGTIAYEGDDGRRPEWLKKHFAEMRRQMREPAE